MFQQDKERDEYIEKLTGFAGFHKREMFRYIPSEVAMKEAKPSRKAPAAESFAAIRAARAQVMEQLQDPNTRLQPDKYKALLTRKHQLDQMVDENYAMSKMEETDDFNQWILGKGKESDHVRTPWYRTPITNIPGAREYVLQFVRDRFKFLEYVHSLQMMGPKDIKEALEYFRFIVRGKEGGKLNYLEEWSRIDTMKEMSRKYGQNVAEKLSNWPISRGDVLPDKDIKLLATDFRSYIDHHWEYDEDKRRSKFEQDGLREELLVKLAALQHHDDIRDALRDYYDRFDEKENLVLMNIEARTQLFLEREKFGNRFASLPPNIRRDSAVKEVYERRRRQYNSQIAAVEERIKQLFQDLQNDPEKVRKIRELIGRRNVPDGVKALLFGDPSEQDLLLVIADELEAGENLLDGATVLAGRIRSVADTDMPLLLIDENGNPDHDRIDSYAELLRDIHLHFVQMRVRPANRENFQ